MSSIARLTALLTKALADVRLLRHDFEEQELVAGAVTQHPRIASEQLSSVLPQGSYDSDAASASLFQEQQHQQPQSLHSTSSAEPSIMPPNPPCTSTATATLSHQPMRSSHDMNGSFTGDPLRLCSTAPTSNHNNQAAEDTQHMQLGPDPAAGGVSMSSDTDLDSIAHISLPASDVMNTPEQRRGRRGSSSGKPPHTLLSHMLHTPSSQLSCSSVENVWSQARTHSTKGGRRRRHSDTSLTPLNTNLVAIYEAMYSQQQTHDQGRHAPELDQDFDGFQHAKVQQLQQAFGEVGDGREIAESDGSLDGVQGSADPIRPFALGTVPDLIRHYSSITSSETSLSWKAHVGML